MPRVNPMDFDDLDEAPQRVPRRVNPKNAAASRAASAPLRETLLADGARACASAPSFLSWIGRARARSGEPIGELLDALRLSVGEPFDAALRRAAERAAGQDDGAVLRDLALAGAAQARPDGSQDLMAKAFSAGAAEAASALLAAGWDAQGPWDQRTALEWALARGDAGMASLALLSSERPGFAKLARKALAEGLLLCHMRLAERLSPEMAAWCAERDGQPFSPERFVSALQARLEAGLSLEGGARVADAWQSAAPRDARAEGEFAWTRVAALLDPPLAAWAWRASREAGREESFFGFLSSAALGSEEARLACARALLDEGASPLADARADPQVLDRWPALGALFAREEHEALARLASSGPERSAERQERRPSSRL
jgi:hypothetical protein